MLRQSLVRLTRVNTPSLQTRTFTAAVARMGEGDTGGVRAGGQAQGYVAYASFSDLNASLCRLLEEDGSELEGIAIAQSYEHG